MKNEIIVPIGLYVIRKQAEGTREIFKMMANEIKETPVLNGKDATRFIKKMEENLTIKLDEEALSKMKDNYSKLNYIANF
jgi:hypothetical protein